MIIIMGGIILLIVFSFYTIQYQKDTGDVYKRQVLIGAAGYATGSIIAGKIENRVPDVRIVSILSSDPFDC